MKFLLSALIFLPALAFSVVNNGIITFTPDGALSHTLWRMNPGQTQPQFAASFTGSVYVVNGSISAGTTFYVRSIFPADSGQCCKESDFGFVVTPPDAPGTNVLRFIGPVNARLLQGASSPAGPWTDLALISNQPVTLTAQQKQFFRAKATNLPPPLPQ